MFGFERTIDNDDKKGREENDHRHRTQHDPRVFQQATCVQRTDDSRHVDYEPLDTLTDALLVVVDLLSKETRARHHDERKGENIQGDEEEKHR